MLWQRHEVRGRSATKHNGIRSCAYAVRMDGHGSSSILNSGGVKDKLFHQRRQMVKHQIEREISAEVQVACVQSLDGEPATGVNFRSRRGALLKGQHTVLRQSRSR